MREKCLAQHRIRILIDLIKSKDVTEDAVLLVAPRLHSAPQAASKTGPDQFQAQLLL